MEDYGLVSIITPNYNCGRFIAETIKSVQAQTYQNWELLIQDDGSTDESLAIAERYAIKDQRVKIAVNERNSGAAVTRNNALQRAKGKWIAFLDSDDLWHFEKLEKQLMFMVEHDYGFSYTSYSEIDENDMALGISIMGPKKITKRGMYNYCWPGCLTVMYNAGKVGLIQISDIKKNNDYAMWLKVIKKADCYLLNEDLAKYRKRLGSISNHGYVSLIKWHWKLYREGENMNVISSVINTFRNLLFGVYKKAVYVKRNCE